MTFYCTNAEARGWRRSYSKPNAARSPSGSGASREGSKAMGLGWSDEKLAALVHY